MAGKIVSAANFYTAAKSETDLLVGLFETFNPRGFADCNECLDKLQKHDPKLRRNFARTAFAATTLNLGKQSVSVDHVDIGNSPKTFCALTPLSDHDPARGGHLVLSDLGLIIEFPPGATILLPSSLLRHSNTTIQKGETRYCFVQYFAGGLFRWVANGFCTNEDWEARASDEEVAARHALEEASWKSTLDTFLNIAELSP